MGRAGQRRPVPWVRYEEVAIDKVTGSPAESSGEIGPGSTIGIGGFSVVHGVQACAVR
jgi:hypothetical protein